MNMQRNSRCWCGSGKKYKQCHEKWDDRYNVMKLEGHVMPERTLIKSPEDIRLIRKAAAINNGVLDEVAKHIRPGMTTEAVNTLVHEFTVNHGGIPPRSTMRVSPRASAHRSTMRSVTASLIAASCFRRGTSSMWT